MKARKYIVILLAGITLSMSLTACAQIQAQPATSIPATEADNEHFVFTDSVGREVELPVNIERITPSGPLAQIFLYTLAPNHLVGLASEMTETQLQFMDSHFRYLPVFGNFSAGTLNLESVMFAAPQVIIDIGQITASTTDDMQDLQDRTGIPTIFIHVDDMQTMRIAYATLGEILGVKEQAENLINYITDHVVPIIDRAAIIPETERRTVFYAQNDGLTAVIAGSIHADVIDFAGGINVADVEQTIRGGAAEISMEQLLLWQPDLILFAPGSIYDTVATLSEWHGLTAIQEGRFYEIPFAPYDWMGRPPSANRLLGISWLANLLYPEIFPFDMIEETKIFFRLFYHYDITNAQVEVLLAKSSLR